MTARGKAVALAVGSTAFILAMAAFLGLDRGFTWGSMSLARVLTAAAAWVTAYGVTRVMGREQRRGWLPWAHIAAAFYAFALIDTAIVYFRVILNFPYGLYLLAFLEIVPMASLTAGCFIKGKSLPSRFFNVRNIIYGSIALAVSAALYLPPLVAVLSAPRAPAVALVLSLLPSLYVVALVLAVYVSTSFGRGVVGRPWNAIAVGTFLLASAQFLSLWAACWRGNAAAFLSASQVCVLGGYLAVGWGAFYHRAVVLKDLS